MPWQCEGFHTKLGDEKYIGEILDSPAEAGNFIESWRLLYNTRRPQFLSSQEAVAGRGSSKVHESDLFRPRRLTSSAEFQVPDWLL